ncbi:MAG TPA: amidohydrolase, partial [Pyrodictium sp.]|nr:amidohydrolase [Pyrodictium sp.]
MLNRCRLVLYSWRGDIGKDVSVYVENGRIAWIGTTAPPLGAKSGLVIDCREHILMPCLYNAHTHAAMVLLRGYHDDSELMDWLGHMWAVEWKLDPHTVYLASKL